MCQVSVRKDAKWTVEERNLGPEWGLQEDELYGKSPSRWERRPRQGMGYHKPLQESRYGAMPNDESSSPTQRRDPPVGCLEWGSWSKHSWCDLGTQHEWCNLPSRCAHTRRDSRPTCFHLTLPWSTPYPVRRNKFWLRTCKDDKNNIISTNSWLFSGEYMWWGNSQCWFGIFDELSLVNTWNLSRPIQFGSSKHSLLLACYEDDIKSETREYDTTHRQLKILPER